MKFRKDTLNHKKYNIDTPINILKEALLEDKLRKGNKKEHITNLIEQKIELAKEDKNHLQDVVDYLNKHQTMLSLDEIQNKDQQLRNISTLLEQKGQTLNNVNYDILHHISRFENLNNLEKRMDIEDMDPPDVRKPANAK